MENLKEIRRSSGLKVQKIADELKVSRKTYYNLENGKTPFKVEDLIILSKLFDVDIMRLVEIIRGDKNARICKVGN